MTRSKKGKNNTKPLLITKYKSEIINKVKDNQVVIIVGQTGSGKSTQVPQYLDKNRDKLGLSDYLLIACLHPRSVAAISLAERVAIETNTECGVLVGYRVRFYKMCEIGARIVYMTAGFMSRLLCSEATIDDYGVVIIDEAHERSVQIDLVMGQMKLLLALYPRLRLIIMSATLNVDEIIAYYPRAATVRVAPAKDHVEVVYRPIKGGDFVKVVCETVLEIIQKKGEGHVLVFVPSEDKVWRCKRALEGVAKRAVVLPFFGAMDLRSKKFVFDDYYGKRKIVVATNIAETSLTIDGVRFVIDTGFVKRVRFDHDTRVERWMTERVSAAEAEQRKGRTGRTGDRQGICYRLYERYDYHSELSASPLAPFVADIEEKYSLSELRVVAENIASLADGASLASVCDSIDEILANAPISASDLKDRVTLRYPVPEMQTANLDAIVLAMKAMRVDIALFPFIVSPNEERVKAAVAHLKALSLFQDNASLTPLGELASTLPLSPALAKVAVMGSNMRCREDVFIIIALLSSGVVIKGNRRRRQGGGGKQAGLTGFESEHGDLITLLQVYEEAEQNNFSPNWCKDNDVISSTLNFAVLVVKQLCRLLPGPFPGPSREFFSFEERIHDTKIAFLCGFFENLSVQGDGACEMVDGRTGAIYQHSCVDKNYKL